MFHRQKTDNEMMTQPQQKARAEESSVTSYVKTEKEKGMYQNQSAQSANPAASTTEESGEGETSRPIDIPGSSAPAGLQRQMQPPRMPGAFPGAGYSSPSPATASAPGYAPAANKAQDGRRLVVGEGISLSGEIEACDVLIVEGTIEAALKGARILEIAETGVFYGAVEIEEATVAGRFEGDLTVNGRLTIRSSGSITGSIAYKELAVEAGAVLDGKVTPLSAAGKVEKKPEGSRPAQVKKPAGRTEQSAGGELPFTNDRAVAGA